MRIRIKTKLIARYTTDNCPKLENLEHFLGISHERESNVQQILFLWSHFRVLARGFKVTIQYRKHHHRKILLNLNGHT